MRVRALSLATVLALVALLLAAPSPPTALQELRDPTGAADPTGPVVALVALLAWALAGWLLLVVAATLAGRLPGVLGRAGTGLARRAAPAAVRRAVEVALGLTVTATVLAAAPASAADRTPTGPAAAAAAAATAATAAAATAAGTAALPGPASLDWPGTPAGPDLDWPAATAAASPPAPPTAPVRAAQAPAAGGEQVVVRPGDSLWEIAERDLSARTGAAPDDARTAAAWPAWWAANRAAVGDDPDVVHPGTRLTPPQDLPPAASSSDDA